MLNNTFCCFEGVSVFAERRLWTSGCFSWEEFLRVEQKTFSKKNKILFVTKFIKQNQL